MVLTNLAFGGAIVLYQRNIAGADIGTSAAFNTIEKVVRRQSVVVLGLGVPQQLLRQQAGRAGFGAHAAANTGLSRGRRWHFFFAGHQQTVGGFYHRHMGVGQGKTHHWPAHHHTRGALGIIAVGAQYMVNRRAEQDFYIALGVQCLADDGGDAFYQRLAVAYSTINSGGGAHVLTDHANTGGNLSARHFATGQNLNQLFFPARGILGGENRYLNIGILNSLAQSSNGFRFVVLYTDHYPFRLAQQVRQNLRARDYFIGAQTHQHIVGGNIRLALSAVDNQGINKMVGTWIKFDGCRKTRATKTGNARLANLAEQDIAFQRVIIGRLLQGYPAIFAIGVQQNTGVTHA